MENTLQKSDKWFEDRSTRFTSSAIYKLMGVKGLGETGKSYAMELAINEVEGRNLEDQYESFDMQKGTELEPKAREQFIENHAADFFTVVESDFVKLSKATGSSPDGLVNDDAVLEIKCPKDSTFFNIVSGREYIDQKYIYQMQHQMYCTGRTKAYFFCFIVRNGRNMWHEIVVHRDDKVISLMKERIAEAEKVKQEFISDLRKNRQYIAA